MIAILLKTIINIKYYLLVINIFQDMLIQTNNVLLQATMIHN